MQVNLIEYTGSGYSNPADHAASILIFTKGTRLNMTPAGLEEIKFWPDDLKITELEYMANTIPSSWEFCDYTFMIEGVTRAFTHQLVRTRTASFAQQTLRVLDVSQGVRWDYLTGPTIKGDAKHDYDMAMKVIDDCYKYMIKNGVAIEDARGILPTNILTNIVMKINMRNFVELVQKRSGPRVQGEYRDVLLAMQQEVRKVHPWIDIFIGRTFDRAAADLDKEITEFDPINMVIHNMNNGITIDKEKLGGFKTRLMKLVDQLRSKQ